MIYEPRRMGENERLCVFAFLRDFNSGGNMKLKVTKENLENVEWLRKAAGISARYPELLSSFRSTDHLVATDGFRLHAVNMNLPVGLFRIVSVSNKGEIVVERNAEKYPLKYEDILIDVPAVGIYCNPRYLIEALSGFEGSDVIKLSFKTADDPFEIAGKTRNGDDAFAVIMPMRVQPVARFWRPEDAKQEGVLELRILCSPSE